MNLTIHEELEQGSDLWLELRCGVMSASVMNSILTPTLKPSNNDKTRQAVYDLACQRITSYVEPQFWTDSMLRGVDDEVAARDLYSEYYSEAVEVGGMCREFDFGHVWYSPDGMVGDDGLIEVKSRRQGLHFKTIVDNEVPTEHILQCQAGLLISGRKWIDYISICKGMPLFVKRVYPEEKYQLAILEACALFEQKVRECIKSYENNVKAQSVLIETERDPEIEEIYLG